MSEPARSSESRPDLIVVLMGAALIALYFRYASTWNLSISFWVLPGSSLGSIGLSELRFWLVHGLLLVPGALLVGWGLAASVDTGVRRLTRPILASDKSLRIAALAYLLLLFIIYAFMHAAVMLDAPITDDENGVRLGAQIWLSGELTMPRPIPEGAFPNLFTWSKDGRLTSFDWPGGIAFQAIALKTGMGQSLYALAAAISGLATAAAAHRWLGAKAAVVTAAIWLLSPMGMTLSITTHAHVVGRLSIALALYFLSRVNYAGRDGTEESSPAASLIAGLGMGASAGLGLCTRPFETLFLLAPVAVWLVWRAVKNTAGARRVLLGAIVGLIPLVAAHAIYNAMITGSPHLPPRFDREHILANAMMPRTILERLSTHLTHNAMLFAIFCVGPLGAAAAALSLRISRIHRTAVLLLSACLGSVFLLTLAHDNVGIHSVGPIHYSEAAVPAILLLTFFIHGLLDHIKAPQWRQRIVSMFTLYVVIGLGTFTLHQISALGQQAETTQMPYAAIEKKGIENAVVVADFRARFYMPDTGGSWVLEYPNPSPTGDDNVIFVREESDLLKLREIYPDREFWRMRIRYENEWVHWRRVDFNASPGPAAPPRRRTLP